MPEFPLSQGGSGGEDAQKKPEEIAKIDSTILMNPMFSLQRNN